MILKKQFDILELGKLELSILNNLALWFGIDTVNKGKQTIIYELLDEQAKRNATATGETQTQPATEKKRVYLVAKVSGLPEAEVTAKYENARVLVESYGYEAVVPTECIAATYKLALCNAPAYSNHVGM